MAVLAVVVPWVTIADVRPAALFTDSMVIQRETKAPVWGSADPGEKVTVTASWGKSAKATADEDGTWSVKLKTPAAGGPYTITIQGDNTVEIKDVLAGEVWFCSGQSNMDFILQQLTRSVPGRTEKKNEAEAEYVKKEIATAQDDLLRQFTVEKRTSPLKLLDTLEGSWIASAPTNNPNFSATAYFFGRELRQELDVPVGLIKCAWGGTRVEPWIPAEDFEKDEEMAAYYESNMADLKSQLAKWDPEQAKARHEVALKRWEANKKGRRPRMASHPEASPQFPTTLFNAMVSPVIPYAIKGAIWYQGESNAKHNTEKYECHFTSMIRGWRKQWNQGDFPFYFAQLAQFRAPVTEPLDYDGWASVCDQQRRTLDLKNTGMAVLNDIGEAKDIHPHNKMDVGKRLALWALKNDYKQKVPACSGPLYKKHKIKGNKVIITFDHEGSGLMTGVKEILGGTQETDEPLKRFQICGEDRQWRWAEAVISGKDTVTVSHPDVPQPTVVRYAWAPNPLGANLYNKEGLPASIFTTEAEIPAGSAPEEPARAGVASAKAQPAPAQAESCPGASLKKDDRIVFLGDSTTAAGARPARQSPPGRSRAGSAESAKQRFVTSQVRADRLLNLFECSM